MTTPDVAGAAAPGRLSRLGAAVGAPGRRPVLLGHDRGVRAARQHLRPVPDGRQGGRATACSPSSSPSSCSAAGRWCCTTTSAAGCARSPAATRRGSRTWSRSPTAASAISARSSREPAATFADPRSVRPRQHHGQGRGSPQRRGDPRSGVLSLSGGRAGPRQPADVVAAGDDAELGDEPAREAPEHGVRADRRAPGRRQRSADRQPARRVDRGAAAGGGGAPAVRASRAAARRSRRCPTTAPRSWAS